MGAFTIGTTGGDHISVEINGRPVEEDDWDWVCATIFIHAGAFSGSYDASLMTCDFPRFRRQLERLYESLEGAATFDTIENQLIFEATGNGHGGIGIKGVARDRAGDGNELRFHFEIDQTFLRPILADLQRIESEFAK